MFRSLRFSRDGELPAEEVLPTLAALGTSGARDPGELLSDSLSKVMLFLLFVASAHLESAVDQELHSRVKARVSRD